MNDAQPHSSLREFISVLFRHKGKCLLFFVVVVGGVVAATMAATEIYESEARLLVKPGRETVAADPTIPADRIMYLRRSLEETLNSELELLRSRLLAEKVVDELGPETFLKASDEGRGGPPGTRALTPDLSQRQRALELVMESVSSQAPVGTNVLYVTFRSPSPELARQALEAYIEAYLELHLEVFEAGNTYQLFQEQVERLAAELAGIEEELRTFKTGVNLAELDDQRRFLIERISLLKRRRQEAAGELAAARAATVSLETAVNGLPDTFVLEERAGTPNFFMNEARIRILELEMQEKELLSQFPESHRQVQAVREQLREAREAVEGEQNTLTEVTTGRNQTDQDLKVYLERERARAAALDQEVAALDGLLGPMEEELGAMIDQEIRLAQLERRRDLAEQTHRGYVERLEEARVVRVLEQQKVSNISIVQPATEPIAPVLPRKGLNVLVGLLIGFFGGVGLAFVSDYFDHTFRTGTQVEKHLNIPVLVSIPKTGRSAMRL